MLSLLKLNPIAVASVVMDQAKARAMKIDSLQLQPIEDGYGPIYEKSYTVYLDVEFNDVIEAFKSVKLNLNIIFPSVVANIDEMDEKTMKVGQRFQISMLGGLRAPIEVLTVGPMFIEFATLTGHPEAGTISFKIEKGELGRHHFTISSTSRNSGRLFDFFYTDLKLMEKVQVGMWKKTCSNFFQLVSSDKSEPTILVKSRTGGGEWESSTH